MVLEVMNVALVVACTVMAAGIVVNILLIWINQGPMPPDDVAMLGFAAGVAGVFGWNHLDTVYGLIALVLACVVIYYLLMVCIEVRRESAGLAPHD